MSGETVTSSNALQFTNDNKHAYAYSGLVAVGNTETTLFSIQTQSEYLITKLQINYAQKDNDDFLYKVYFNDIVISAWSYDSAQHYGHQNNVAYLIIPPFTTVKATAANITSGTARNQSAVLTAKVGMAQRVGNLDD